MYDINVINNTAICTIVPGLPLYQLSTNPKFDIAHDFNGSSNSTGTIAITDKLWNT